MTSNGTGSFLEFMINQRADEDKVKPAPIALDIEAVRLRDAYAVYCRENRLKPGDIVREKRGIAFVTDPRKPPTLAYIVMDVKPEAEPHYNVTDMATYGLRFDIYLGYYDSDGDFIFLWSDSRRYEPFPEAELVKE